MILKGRKTARTVFQRISNVKEFPKYKGNIINRLAIQAKITMDIEPTIRPRNKLLCF